MACCDSKNILLKTNFPWLFPAVAIWIINTVVSFYLRSHVLALYDGSNLSPWMRGTGWAVVPLVMVALVILAGAVFCCILRGETKWRSYFRLMLMLFTGLGVIFFFACFVQLVVDVGVVK